MSTGNTGGTGIGAQLYGLLPEVYRSRDNGDLRNYLEACGEVMDLIRGALTQRLADSLPDHPDSQGWVLPYLAQLLDVKLASPSDAEWRQELAQTVALRQRKGTVGAVEQILLTLGRFAWETEDPAREPALPVYLQEGWRRVAVTPRIGQPLASPEAVGALPVPDTGNPRRRAVRAPALPVATVDFRYISRKVSLPPYADKTPRPPLQMNPHGVPLAPGRFQDTSRRTPDLRAPSPRQGHFHPKRVLAFVLPRVGFFAPGWQQGDSSNAPEDPWRSRPRRRPGSLPSRRFETDGEHLIENRVIVEPQGLEVVAGRLVLRNCVVVGDVTLDAGDQEHVLEDCIIQGTLTLSSGHVGIQRSALARLSVQVTRVDAPVARVQDGLLMRVQSAGLIELLSATVMETLQTRRCWASDSLFAGTVALTEDPTEPVNCFRYCRLPPASLQALIDGDEASECFDDPPVFRSTVFGTPGAGVLLPASGPRLLDGAEDGGELGAHHHLRYALRDQAVVAKVRESLPTGLDIVLVSDESLGQPLPAVSLPSP
ncbi:hypothetical protein CYFUS_004475 [Cystobacter fuscus]|uniref:Uncharacterized protein n=1 Tax=Cystobacter fuscus TaxID=43 RepID=A0A250J787_9BACT|nr:phage tail protein [Cystobacter fuscus]ATB39036.1 hypothetical protein CYFUS_004475 [Cystobacter fuscus]